MSKKKRFGVPSADKMMGSPAKAGSMGAGGVPKAGKPSVEIEIKTLLNGSKKKGVATDKDESSFEGSKQYSEGMLINPKADAGAQQERVNELRERLKRKMKNAGVSSKKDAASYGG